VGADKVGETSHDKEASRAARRLCAFPRTSKIRTNKHKARAKSRNRR
jgi:ribosomal protein L37E